MKLKEALRIIDEGVNDPGIFKAIFLAGGPGSGKSFVGSELVGIPKGGFTGMDMSFAPRLSPPRSTKLKQKTNVEKAVLRLKCNLNVAVLKPPSPCTGSITMHEC